MLKYKSAIVNCLQFNSLGNEGLQLTLIVSFSGLVLEMNLIFGMFMEPWILRVSCKVSEAHRAALTLHDSRSMHYSTKGFTLTLQETRSIHDSMNIPKIEFIVYIYILL